MALLLPHVFEATLCADGSAEPPQYSSSHLERRWLNGPSSGNICKIAVLQRESAQQWLNYAARSANTVSAQDPRQSAAGIAGRSELTFRTLLPVEPTAEERPMLSKFHYRRSSGWFTSNKRTEEWIEPISGVGRHPLAKVCEHNPNHKIGSGNLYDAEGLFNISYLVIANNCDANGVEQARCSPRSRNLFFDLGCSIFDDGNPLDLASGSGFGPSLPIFTKLYEQRCIDFDAIYASLQTQPWALVQLKIPQLKGMVYTRYCAGICCI
jgi:hypothetical protein